MHMGERIRDERERLGFSQVDFAALAGATRKTLFNWESGAAAPNATALAVWADHGLDVLYVVTGQRSQPVPETATLSPRQRALLDNFNNTSEEGKKIIEGTADMAAKSTSPKRNAKRESEQLPTIGTVNGQVIQGNQTNKGPQVFNFGPGSVKTGSRKPSD